MNDPKVLAQEQELNLIGALLKDPSKLDLVKEIITPDDIWLVRARDAYAAMLKLREQDLSIDAVTVGDELARHGLADEWGGYFGLQKLRQDFRGDEADSYAWKILDYSAKRQMVEHFSTGANWSNNGRDAGTIRDDMIRRLTDVKTPNAKTDRHTMTMKESLSASYDLMANGREGFVPTGFIDLDKMFYGGFLAPDLTIWAARPGQGKTSLLLTMAVHAAKKGRRVLFLSLEMSNEQVTTRIISMETGIPYGALISGKMTAQEWDKVNDAVAMLESLPLHLNDTPAITVNGIRQTYRKIEARHSHIDIIFVDYLQLQAAEGKYNTREQEVSSISRGLKAMAKEFSVPVHAAAQLSRAVELRSEKRPVLSDLRESGSLEQDSDNVIFIYRPDQYEKDTTKQGRVELITAKHRNGPTGSVELIFRSAVTKFENAETRIFSPNGGDR